MRLVEQVSGVGGLKWRGETFTGIRYRINRFQGQAANGLPVPGLHRIEGTVEGLTDAARLVGSSITLELGFWHRRSLTALVRDLAAEADDLGDDDSRERILRYARAA